MKYLLFILFFLVSTSIINAQSSAEMEILTIDKKLDKVLKNPTNNPQQEKLLLEIKKESEKSGYNEGALRSIDYLMRLYSNQGKYKEAVKIGNGIIGIIPDAPTSKEKRIISNIFRRRALALSNFGFLEESLKDFKTAISYAEKIENNDEKLYNLSLCYENITIYYGIKQFENKKHRDSIMYYHKKSLEKALQISDKNPTISQSLKYEQIAFNNMRMGIFYLEQVDNNTKANPDLAEKHLIQALKIHENKAYQIPVTNRILLLNQLSWLYMEKKDYKNSISYAKRALNIEKQHKDPYHRVESFEFLASSYTEIGEKEQSAIYMREYTSLKDSLSIMEKNNTKEPLKQIVSEIDNTHKKTTKNQLILMIIIVLIAIIITVYLWRKQKKLIHKKYEALIDKISHKEENILVNEEVKEAKTLSGITDDALKALLQKLERFEKSEKYLRKDISVAWLANHLDTNAKYLSEGIKTHRDHNFSNYINGLKINYIINKLYDDTIYREYKINYLAEECGFATPRVFLNAFKKETGITPSYFIKELQSEKAS